MSLVYVDLLSKYIDLLKSCCMGTRKLLALSYGLLNRVTTTTKNTDMSQTHIKEDREPNDGFLLKLIH